jgi:O-antigen/teichoic acid export membrane protein
MRYILKTFFKGSDRSTIIKKNIIGSFAIKGLSILTTLILVPLTINLLDKEKYGIWVTIFSIVTWFNIMDIGLGNGFRNKFAIAISQGNIALAKQYVQTLYSSTILISIGLFLSFVFLSFFLEWNNILNLPISFDENIDMIIGVIFGLFCVQLILKNISTLLLSLQKTTISNSLILFSNILSIGIISFSNLFYELDLFGIALIFMTSPIIIYCITTVMFFGINYKELRPKFIVIPQRKYLNELMSLGIKFFIIQITTIVMFSSSSIVITQLFGPGNVTEYSVAGQLFGGPQIVFSIILTPFWTPFTEAYSREDFIWLQKAINKLMFIWIFFSFATIMLWLVSPVVYEWWLGDKILIPYQLSFQFALFTILIMWSSIFSSFLSGIGKIKLALYGAIFQLIVNIPLAIFLSTSLKFGITGVILATNLNLFIAVVLLFIQTKKILNRRAYGIWNK